MNGQEFMSAASMKFERRCRALAFRSEELSLETGRSSGFRVRGWSGVVAGTSFRNVGVADRRIQRPL
jgi:hypothetical protein